jgi:hypothetical protein
MEEIKELKAHADELNRQGTELQTCVELYEECRTLLHDIEPKDPELARAVLSNLSSAYLRTRQASKGKTIALALTSLDPEWFRGFQRLAEACWALKQPAEAIVAFRQAVALCSEPGALSKFTVLRQKLVGGSVTNVSVLLLPLPATKLPTTRTSLRYMPMMYLPCAMEARHKPQSDAGQVVWANWARNRTGLQVKARKSSGSEVWICSDDKGPFPGYLFESPETFEGCEGTLWGLPQAQDHWSATEVARRFARYQDGLVLYSDVELPEIQWLRRRAAAKLASLQPNEAYKDSLVVLDVRLRHAPRLWRRFQVPGDTLLSVLAQKVLIPVMGWSRNFHTYYFRGGTDGTLFGPQLTGAESQMRDWQCDAGLGFLHGWGVFVDDNQARLCDVLNEEQPLEWVYDLGDRTSHLLTVVEVKPMPPPGQACIRILDGASVSPPENFNGIFDSDANLRNWGTVITTTRDSPEMANVDIIALGADHDAGRYYEAEFGKPRTAANMKEMKIVSNYHMVLAGSKKFSWHGFDQGYTALKLQEALGTRAGVQTGNGGENCECCRQDLVWLGVFYSYSCNPEQHVQRDFLVL